MNPTNPLSRWFATATLPVKAFMGISVISAVVVLNKWVVRPHMAKQRYKRAEEWANIIIEQEENDPDGTNNISEYV